MVSGEVHRKTDRRNQNRARDDGDRIRDQLAKDPDFTLDFVDRCEELAANYGLSPFDVMRWSWRKVEEMWISWQKRQRRELKMEAILRGANPLGEMGASAPGTRSPRANGKIENRVRTPYGVPEVEAGERQPTDDDNWDIPPSEMARLSLLLPGAIKMVKN